MKVEEAAVKLEKSEEAGAVEAASAAGSLVGPLVAVLVQVMEMVG